MEIVICDRGWVFVGTTQLDGAELLLTDAQNVRRWGTTNGLGELAQEGPQPQTVLDLVGTVRIPMTSIVARIACDPAKW